MEKPSSGSLVLCGIKHCGKSSAGRLLASKLRVGFVDSDLEMVRRGGAAGEGIRELFLRLGEENFRRFEAEVIRSLTEDEGASRVVALGGGAVSNPFLPREVLKKLGMTIFLDIDPKVAYARIVRRGIPPFLAGAADPEEEFRRMALERGAACRAVADLTIQVNERISVEEIVKKIMAELK